MAYTNSNLVTAQAKLLDNFKNGELRYRNPATYLEILKNSQIMFPNYDQLRTMESRTVEADYMKRGSRSLGSARSHNHTGTVGTTGTLTPSWTTYTDPFTNWLKQGNNNLYSLDEMIANEVENVVKNFAEGLETVATDFIFSSRSHVNIATVEGGFDSETHVYEIEDDKEKRVGQIIKSIMEINKYASSGIVVFCDTVMFNKVSFYAQQGQANNENLAFQFMGIMWVHSVELYTSASGLGYESGFAVVCQEGTIGALPHIPKENAMGIDTKVNTYSTILNPIDGLNYAVHEYWAVGDGTSYGGYTQDVKREIQISIDLAFEDAPLSTSGETVLQAFALIPASV